MLTARSASDAAPLPDDVAAWIVGDRFTENYMEFAMLTLVVYNSCTYEIKFLRNSWRAQEIILVLTLDKEVRICKNSSSSNSTELASIRSNTSGLDFLSSVHFVCLLNTCVPEKTSFDRWMGFLYRKLFDIICDAGNWQLISFQQNRFAGILTPILYLNCKCKSSACWRYI